MICFFCEEEFTNMDLVMQHIRLKHKFMLNSTVACKFDNCNDQFTNVYSLRRHILNKHCVLETKASSIITKQLNDTVLDINASDCYNAILSVPTFDSNNSEGQEKIYNIIETNNSINNNKFDIDIFQSTVFKSALSYCSKNVC